MNDLKEKTNSDVLNLIGYGLAKFDLAFVREFGCDTKTAFNQLIVNIGLAKTEKVISNRQDTFDPYFDNGRKGWWQRNQREHVKLFIDSIFGNEDGKTFANIVKTFIKEYNKNEFILDTGAIQPIIKSKFRQLQETGNEAEFFFMSNYNKIPMFQNGLLSDARLWGDGYDFQIRQGERYILVEVKGIRNKKGALRITQNEFNKAEEYENDYFLVIVSNLSKNPKLNVVQNPLENLKFHPKQTTSIQINYHTESLTW